MLTEQQILDAKVLILDDEPANVRLLERTLERAGYTNLRSLTDSRQFERAFAEFEPDLVLLDLTMPFLDGFDILDLLRANDPPPDVSLPGRHVARTPVLVLTAQVDRESRLRALANGAKDFLTKPFDAMEALLRIRNLLEAHLLQLALNDSRKTAERLLLNVLPKSVARELMDKGESFPVSAPDVSILFADFVDFTKLTRKWELHQLIQELEVCFNYFDKTASQCRLERLKTIGDGYMCAGGIPIQTDTHPLDTVTAAFEMEEFIRDRRERFEIVGKEYWSVRIGVHTGPVIAGVIGKEKFAYDVWGSTVNLAKRIETSGQAGKIVVSLETYERVADHVRVVETYKAALKNAGDMELYVIERPNAD